MLRLKLFSWLSQWLAWSTTSPCYRQRMAQSREPDPSSHLLTLHPLPARTPAHDNDMLAVPARSSPGSFKYRRRARRDSEARLLHAADVNMEYNRRALLTGGEPHRCG
ncbi:hypothetical protein LXA43DRAFT_44866 [Ganoderma leucocontextum]|nr:hypothetical protein LXA43DRAFT_44866 [Ganoderma leucocontextum]